MISAEDVLSTTFSTVKFRGGYDIEEVDDFLDRVTATLRVLEGPVPTGALLSATDVLAQQFATVKLREGYAVAEVDALLDRVARTLNDYQQKALATGAVPVAAGGAHPAGALPVAGTGASPVAAPAAANGGADVPGTPTPSADGLLTPAAAARAQSLPEGAVLGLRVLTQQLQIATVRTQGADTLAVRTPDGAILRVVAVEAGPAGVVLQTVP